MAKATSSRIPWIIGITLSVLAVGLYAFTFRQQASINLVSSVPTSCPPTPYSFQVAIPCGDSLFSRANYRCEKTTRVITISDNSCLSPADWYSLVQQSCRTKAHCPALPPSPIPYPSPSVRCSPPPTCQPWQKMSVLTNPPSTGNPCPTYFCIDLMD